MSTAKDKIFSSEEMRLALVENVILHVNDLLTEIKSDLKNIGQEVKDFKSDIDKKLDQKLDAINSRLWSNFVWTIGFGIGLYGSLFGVLAHALKWF